GPFVAGHANDHLLLWPWAPTTTKGQGGASRSRDTGGWRRYSGAAGFTATAALLTCRGAHMATTSPWPLIHAEREALIADLGTLTNQQWAAPSLCADWTVRDVLGHMISTAKMTPPRFFTSMAAAGFRFNNMNAKGVAAEATTNPADGLAHLRSHLKDT